MSEIRLIVGGFRYGGWKSVRVTRSIESLAGAFDLEVADRWGGQDERWPIFEEDECSVEIDGQTVITGYVDRRSVALSATERTLSYSGRDAAAALVDSSAVLDRWTFRKASVLDIARKVAEPFGIPVSVQPGLELPAKPPAKFVVNPGDDAFGVIERAARLAGVLAVSDGVGGIRLTRAGASRAADLVEGKNILTASVEHDASQRFATYIVATQVQGTDEAAGPVTRVRDTATDPGVRRTDRVLLIRPESGVTTDYARRRADWEARIRAARAEAVTILVVGWAQPGGGVWPVNALARVSSPSIGVSGELLIATAEHRIDDTGGEITQLRLVRPDAFDPEPEAIVRNTGSGVNWKIHRTELDAFARVGGAIVAGVGGLLGDDD
jgi:prophage tail gpP-like protein